MFRIDCISRANAAYLSKQTDRQTDMAPSNISPGSAATVLSFVILAGLQLETRFRVGEVLAAPRPELSDDDRRPHSQPARHRARRPVS